jgi:hypothetical protein
MTWNNITLAHYQAIYPITLSKEDDWEKDIKIVAILNNLTENQIDSMPESQYRALKAKSSFIYSELPKGRTPFYIRGKKRKYKVNYNIEQMPFARYAEVKSFVGHNEADYVNNLHLLMASMVIPMKKKLGVWVLDKYNAELHADYAEDLTNAPFRDVYHTSVFFCHLYRNSMYASKDFILEEWSQAMTMDLAKSAHEDLCRTLDGFIIASRLPTLKESLYRRLGIPPPSGHSTPSPT